MHRQTRSNGLLVHGGLGYREDDDRPHLSDAMLRMHPETGNYAHTTIIVVGPPTPDGERFSTYTSFAA